MQTSLFIKSPLGPIFISEENEQINEISFINSFKGKNVPEDKINYETPSSPTLAICVQQLNEYFTGSRTHFDFPLMFQGTPFQHTVWRELATISYGRTITYLQLSKQLKNIKAIRAVGKANGCNKIAIVIPCHRVIGSTGALVGYAGDLWRKQWLLDLETKFANGVQKLF